MSSARFDRQRLLPEVGDAGQRLLGEAVLRLPADCSPEVQRAARLYGQAVGLGRISDEQDPAAGPFAHHQSFRHASSSALAEGAHLALSAVRKLLQFPQPRS